MAQGTARKQKKRSKSVLKNARQTIRRAEVNRANRTRFRGAVRRLRTALSAGDAETAGKLMGPTFSELDHAARKRVLPRNTASRYKSRLTLALNKLRASKS
jgi:small subunit ribosomal protein S20